MRLDRIVNLAREVFWSLVEAGWLRNESLGKARQQLFEVFTPYFSRFLLYLLFLKDLSISNFCGVTLKF